MSEDPPGLVDTNVFIHALTRDAHAEECLCFLEAIQRGEVTAQLEPVVVHQLSYALPHYRKGMTRFEIAEYLLSVLAWQGIVAQKGLLVSAVERWRDSPRLAFVDAYLAALAEQEHCPVYTKNVSELAAQGVSVADPLPKTAS
ncbi:MAG: type II toxin-antitoxin system VapC family toxin [Anaerolineae bacterium]|nr:type II toxin-antitoxin system VapC family toxin [Anaerolineae bacterium]